jgi:hypothetical protein
VLVSAVVMLVGWTLSDVLITELPPRATVRGQSCRGDPLIK